MITIELIGTIPEFGEGSDIRRRARLQEFTRFLACRRVEVAELDFVVESGKVTAYRAKLKVSFKYEGVTNLHHIRAPNSQSPTSRRSASRRSHGVKGTAFDARIVTIERRLHIALFSAWLIRP